MMMQAKTRSVNLVSVAAPGIGADLTLRRGTGLFALPHCNKPKVQTKQEMEYAEVEASLLGWCVGIGKCSWILLATAATSHTPAH